MPSVRVKRRDYASLTDRPHTAGSGEPPRSLANIFRPLSAHGQIESRDSLPQPPQATHNPFKTRVRAGSRVYGSLRLQEPLLGARPASQGSSPRPHSAEGRLVTLPGPTADIQVPNDGRPGLIDSALSLPEGATQGQDGHHHDDIVEHLEVIDPQVATVSHLTNAANSILFPPLAFYSRKPVVMLSAPPQSAAGDETGSMLEDSLDRHVEDVMRRRARLKRVLMGVWSFLKTPMGIITGIYGFLVVFWGAAIVLFLAKIINLHNDDLQGFWVEVSSQVVNGLFTATGIGFMPSRVLDTYRIGKIYHYKRLTKKLRAKAGLPQLFDVDDLPDPAYDPNYVHVLTNEQQKDLHRQQVKFQHSQTWYRAHGTETHRAFPISYALLICCLNDGNSVFQAILCACMWSMNRFQRPPWTTGTLIPASFLCGIFSAVFIARGTAITKRTAEVKEKLQAALAMEQPEIQANGSGGLTFLPGPEAANGNGKTPPIKEKASSEVEKLEDSPPDLDILVDEQMVIPSAPVVAKGSS
ncbi:integral membrane protein [Moniliophthora roreri]|nr:integral membrane protein [Moniliophthora roreri]